MNSLTFILTALYTTIIVSLIWARYRFFKIGPNIKSLYIYVYDPAAAIQILATYYFFINPVEPISTKMALIGISLYAISLVIFWLSIFTVEALDFAFSENIKKLITSGPYSLVRHPFYLSYAVAWGSSTIMFNSIILWITLVYMMAYYYLAAKSEEKAIMDSPYSEEYGVYCQNVGMFLPRIKKWKN